MTAQEYVRRRKELTFASDQLRLNVPVIKVCGRLFTVAPDSGGLLLSGFGKTSRSDEIKEFVGWLLNTFELEVTSSGEVVDRLPPTICDPDQLLTKS